MQYCSADYVAALNEAGFAISMSRTGNPYDNAHMESFFKTLKYGEVHLADYETVEDVIERLPISSRRCTTRSGCTRPWVIVPRRSSSN